MEIVVESVALKRRVRLWWAPIVLVTIALTFALSVAGFVGWMIPAVLLSAFHLVTAVAPDVVRRRLRVSESGVWLGDRRVCRRATIRCAFVVPRGADAGIRLESTWGTAVDLEFAPSPSGLEVASSCVDLLGFGPDRRAVEFVNPLSALRSAFGGLAVLGVGLLVVLGVGPDTFAGRVCGAATLVVAYLVARSVRSVDLVVGADGIELRGSWRHRYVPFSQLVAVQWLPDGFLEINGGPQSLWSLSGFSLRGDAPAAAGFLFAVERARSRCATSRHDTVLAELIARRGRSLEEWRASLRALVDVGSGYRARGLTPADLAALLDDPSADEELRVGAALVLRELNPATEVTRIRVAAEACAHAPMRAALERAAEGALDEATMKRLKGSA